MSTFSRFLSCALMLSLACLAGCSLLPSFGGSGAAHVSRGGFSVVVDGPGLPGAGTVVADIGSYAQGHGFVRQGAADRYVSGDLILEVTRQPDQHRVNAYLHNNGGGNEDRAIAGFYRGFSQEHAARYGGSGRITETAYADDSEHGVNMFGKPVETNQTAGRAFGNGQ